ncbi:DUF4245 domain-containing protein [Leucobacter insecticola]|uniref:DUF4245 domain-containing protein n=1 Tax=Leucobacter insecticola TaxID=2714934 RepID=A0A6G8FM79_9MICO|nr:DUF4245 domain-containing protein [Leucobacter insecticola]QIM17192.1 DUF4245 domain-containing protein [Leucobacter insecticola]
MAKKPKPPAIVAELGRPETKAETAARKATDSRNYRQRKTVNNLIFSLIVTLGVVLVIFLAVPRGVGGFEEQALDVSKIAAESSPGAGRPLVAPEVPEGWKAKQAVLRESDGIVYWQINYTTADEAFASVVQAFSPDGSSIDEAWVSKRLEQQSPTGTEQLGGTTWIVYDHQDRKPDKANLRFGLQGLVGDNTLLVYGTDTPGTLRVLATQVVDSLESATGTSNSNTLKEAS